MIDMSTFLAETTEATARIGEYVYQTPLEYSSYLSRISGADVYLKCECLQKTGSFKIRGAANFILSLTEKERERGLVTASTGNHAVAFAHIVDQLEIDGTIYMPESSQPAKTEALREYNVRLESYGVDCVETEIYARKIAHENNQIYVSPYNHLKIIAGQATIGVELLEQSRQLDTLFCPVGGGGLISGIAGYLKAKQKNIEIIGTQSSNSSVMYQSVQAGHIVEVPSLPTIADGSAGGIETGALTFDFCAEFVDRFVLLDESEIRAAIRLIIEKHQLIIEGSAALSVAGFLKESKIFAGKKVALILSGRRISGELLADILSRPE